jgi:hypothetical protein
LLVQVTTTIYGIYPHSAISTHLNVAPKLHFYFLTPRNDVLFCAPLRPTAFSRAAARYVPTNVPAKAHAKLQQDPTATAAYCKDNSPPLCDGAPANSAYEHSLQLLYVLK